MPSVDIHRTSNGLFIDNLLSCERWRYVACTSRASMMWPVRYLPHLQHESKCSSVDSIKNCFLKLFFQTWSFSVTYSTICFIGLWANIFWICLININVRTKQWINNNISFKWEYIYYCKCSNIMKKYYCMQRCDECFINPVNTLQHYMQECCSTVNHKPIILKH